MHDLDSLLSAEAALSGFIQALRERDDAAAAALIYPPSIDTWGVRDGRVCARYLASSGLTDVDLDRLGIVHTEMLSALGAEWVMAIEPHLDALARLEASAPDDAPLVSPRECASAIAAMVMLVFAIEAAGARLASLGRLDASSPMSIVDALPDSGWQQELTELMVVRDVVVHNHIWRVEVTFSPDWAAVEAGAREHVFGERGRQKYRTAVGEGSDRTKRLRLHVVPTAIRRTDVVAALPVAVRTFDYLASLDVENMRSLADLPVRMLGRVTPLRDVQARIGAVEVNGNG